MTIERIKGLLSAPNLSMDEVSRETGISRRNLFRIRKLKDSNINVKTLEKLEAWAKGKRAPTEKA